MAGSPLDGLYYAFSIPLGLFNLIQEVIAHNQDDPNSPQVHTLTGPREWFSQPRPASGSAPRLTYISLGESGNAAWYHVGGTTTQYETAVGLALDPLVWVYRPVYYPLDNPDTTQMTAAQAYEVGKANVIAAINDTGGKFALGGYGNGAAVMSLVYDEIRSGSLMHRRADLIAATMFGNLAREDGHTIPGGTDPTGHGVRDYEHRLLDTEEFWWEFANGGDETERDIFATTGDDTAGMDLTAMYEAMMGTWPDTQAEVIQTLDLLFAHPLEQITATVQLLWDSLLLATPFLGFNDPSVNQDGHMRYHFPYPGSASGRTAVELAIDYLTRVGIDYQTHVSLVPVTEVIQVNFQLPLSVSEVGWEALRVSCHTEVWYLDRQNNWRQVLDESRIPVALNLSTSRTAAWYKAHFYCYPIVAKGLQFRFQRIPDPLVGNRPYCVGMRNGLIRRNIYTNSDGTMGIEPQQDPLGNVWTSYVKSWSAANAFDDDPNTFWRSMPLPDPMAVASLYLDCRTPDGGGQLMDALYLDPVYTGQDLNLYYSNDDTRGTLKLSPIAAAATLDENTEWQMGKGRWDTSFDPGTSEYRFPMAWGPLISQDAWVGMEWAPDFDPTAGPATNPVLFEVLPSTPTTGQYWPKIFYDVGAGEIVLELTDGTDVQTYSVALSPLFTRYAPLRIVVGWAYDPMKVYISVKIPNGTEIAHLEATPTGLPPLMTFDGSLGFYDFRGLFTAHVLKLENYALSSANFQANPGVYVSPDPVMPDPGGAIPATSLDNAIYAAAWTVQEQGTGGDHESSYADKTWTPIWRDYYAQKGKLFFPQQIRAKYLKAEFTRLTEEPYPVYDAGIRTSYNTFPVSVTQDATQRHPGLVGIAQGLLTLGADVILSGIGSVNWLNPSTVNNAVNSIFGQVVQPVLVQSGPGTNVTSLPNTSTLDVVDQTRQEVSSPWVYKRSLPSATTLAGHQLNSTYSDTWFQTLTHADDLIGAAVQDAFSPLQTFASNPSSLPQQGQDFWVFPGGSLRMPAPVMNGLTAITEVILGRKPTTETRLRFNTTQVHRYDIRTVTRDAAVAYFAGVREIQPYITTYIDHQDPDRFRFDSYDPTQWVATNTRALDTGPVTTAGSLYTIENPEFDQDIANWDQASGSWTYDGSPVNGHWYPGSARVTPDGGNKELVSSPMDVVPGVHIDASVWVKWAGLTATGGSQALQLQARYYLGDTFVSSQTVGITRTTWPATSHTTGPTTDWAQITAALLSGTGFTVPTGVDRMRLALVVTGAASAGTVWFDTVEVGTTDSTEGTLFKDFITTSTFVKIRCEFTDSGLLQSDDMWARQDPADLNISATALAYYTTTIPDVMPAGMWGDTFAAWGSSDITWGAPRALVAINVDPDRIYDGKRVLHFTRAGGAEEAGVKVRQHTNFVARGLFRIGCVFLKPRPNGNQITVRLRRVSDGVYIHQETFDPVVGYWYKYLTDFIEVPDSEDQIYTVELVCFGDDPDELYLNDLYTEVAHIRYFMRVGDPSAFLHDVTQLRYANSAIVSTTLPVNEFSIQAVILSPKAFAYGVTATPVYLK